jgi:hypothetical protein
MARRVNYGYEKFQKEAKRKKKQQEKLEKKRLSKEAKKGTDAPATAGAEPVAEEPTPTTTE